MLYLLLVFLASHLNYPEQILQAEFTRVQEEVVYDLSKKPLSYSQVLSPQEVTTLRVLACEHYECREMAKTLIKNQGLSAIKMLVWGSHSKDQTVAQSCQILIRELFACFNCRGTGLCPHTHLESKQYPYYRCPDKCYRWQNSLCYICTGTGDLRYHQTFVPQDAATTKIVIYSILPW
jgi:hypothetical protein